MKSACVYSDLSCAQILRYSHSVVSDRPDVKSRSSQAAVVAAPPLSLRQIHCLADAEVDPFRSSSLVKPLKFPPIAGMTESVETQQSPEMTSRELEPEKLAPGMRRIRVKRKHKKPRRKRSPLRRLPKVSKAAETPDTSPPPEQPAASSKSLYSKYASTKEHPTESLLLKRPRSKAAWRPKQDVFHGRFPPSTPSLKVSSITICDGQQANNIPKVGV